MSKQVKFFLDTEFREEGRFSPLELFSIGIVCENNDSLYLENIQASIDKSNNWVKENVLPHLNLYKLRDKSFNPNQDLYWNTLRELPIDTNNLLIKELESNESYNFRCEYELFTVAEIAHQILIFVAENLTKERADKAEFWGYFCDYDWVLFCQLFGRMVDLPRGFPFFCLDLKQEMYLNGIKESLDELTKQDSRHNALEDAKQIKLGYELVNQLLINDRL